MSFCQQNTVFMIGNQRHNRNNRKHGNQRHFARNHRHRQIGISKSFDKRSQHSSVEQGALTVERKELPKPFFYDPETAIAKQCQAINKACDDSWFETDTKQQLRFNGHCDIIRHNVSALEPIVVDPYNERPVTPGTTIVEHMTSSCTPYNVYMISVYMKLCIQFVLYTIVHIKCTENSDSEAQDDDHRNHVCPPNNNQARARTPRLSFGRTRNPRFTSIVEATNNLRLMDKDGQNLLNNDIDEIEYFGMYSNTTVGFVRQVMMVPDGSYVDGNVLMDNAKIVSSKRNKRKRKNGAQKNRSPQQRKARSRKGVKGDFDEAEHRKRDEQECKLLMEYVQRAQQSVK